MLFIGVDPGRQGAVAMLDAAGEFVTAFEMPLSNGELDFLALWGKLVTIIGTERATVGFEAPLQHGSAYQASRANWNAGAAYGVLTAIGLPVTQYTPSSWQAALDCKTKSYTRREGGKVKVDKFKQSITFCEKRWPGMVLATPRGRVMDGIADAACIAEYHRQKTLGIIP